MKTIGIFCLIVISASFLWADDADDWESYEIVNRLLSIRRPSAPVIVDNHVIFTADSGLRRIGVSFAHENFSNVYWFRQMVIPQDRLNSQFDPLITPDSYIDSGLQFYVYRIPMNLKEIEYRLVVNGLWTIDPLNPQSRRDPVSGLTMSVLALPYRPVPPNPLNGLPEGLNFTFRGPPGEIVTVAGNFNGWDPFMYELREYPEGVYSITIPLPPGTYQYVFYHRGQRYVDPYNSRRIYARDGSAASEIVIP
jgi:hypothetical protein